MHSVAWQLGSKVPCSDAVEYGVCTGCQHVLQTLCTNMQLCIIACSAHTGSKLGTVAAHCFQTLRSLTQRSETQCQEASHGRLLKSSQGGSLCQCPLCSFHHHLFPFAICLWRPMSTPLTMFSLRVLLAFCYHARSCRIGPSPS